MRRVQAARQTGSGKQLPQARDLRVSRGLGDDHGGGGRRAAHDARVRSGAGGGRQRCSRRRRRCRASGAHVSPIPAGSRSAPERARHAAELMKLRVMEHCNLLGLGVNPNLVRHAFARLFKPCCAPLCCAVPRVVAARAHVYFSRDSRHGAAAILQIKAALHKDTVSGGAVRTLLGRNVVLGIYTGPSPATFAFAQMLRRKYSRTGTCVFRAHTQVPKRLEILVTRLSETRT